MNEELKKSLTDLIDETLLELEELKKSRFSASEIEVKGPGEGIAGKPSNGKLDMAMSEKDEDKDEDKDEEAEKAEGQNRQSDPDGGHHKPVAGEGMEHGQGPNKGMSGGKSHGNGKNSESDPGDTHWAEKSDKDDDAKDDKKKKKDKDEDEEDGDDKKPPFMKGDHSPSPEQADKQMRSVGMRKSDDEMEDLMKSFVEERVKPLEDKLSTILNLVNKIADQPVPPRGATGREVPLLKNNEGFGGEYLSKSEVASKLFELKKSGTKVETLDITRAEMGQDLSKIIEKYKIS